MLSYGSYGCVYYPGTDCKGTTDTTHVSKIVNTKYSAREIAMSNKIKQIPNYQEFFVPVETSCPIQSTKVKRCKALTYETTFTLLTMPYLKSVQIPFDITTFNTLTYAIELLIEHNLVHFDIKLDNIICTPKPYLIDFGISLDMSDVQLASYFFVYDPYQYIWPIEVHLLCYMIDHNWSEASLKMVCEKVCDSPIKPLLEETEKDYEAKCIQHYGYVWKLPRKEVIAKLIEGWRTWDMYALTLLLSQPHINLHYDAEKRLTPAASRFAT
jgi:serine/threonine protein kinase